MTITLKPGQVQCCYCGLIQREETAIQVEALAWACLDAESCAEGWAGQMIGLCP